jgi:Glycosyl hydrolases family 39
VQLIKLPPRLRNLRIILLALTLIALKSATPSIAGTIDSTIPNQPIPPTLFGLNILSLRATDSWPDAPFTSWRNFHSTWTRLEPHKGKWDFSQLDQDVQLARQHGVEPLLVLMLTPQWASSRPNEPGVHGNGTAAEARKLDDWRNYVRTVATRYKGQVFLYELWNEPNVPKFYSGTVDSLIKLNQTAFEVLKEVDPTITVVSPAASLPYLSTYLKKGGGRYADVIGFHFYVLDAPPEAIHPLSEKVRALLVTHGLGHLEIWNTEAGWPIENAGGPARPISGFSKVLSNSDASAYVARAYILNWVSGIRRFYWYAWQHRSTGLIEDDGRSLKPAAIAYKEIARWLVGTHVTGCSSSSAGLWVCTVHKGDGNIAWIAWNPDRTSTIEAPHGYYLTRVSDLDGTSRTVLRTKHVTVGTLPRLLHFDRGGSQPNR